MCKNRSKYGNDLCDLDFDLVTSRSLGYVDLVHTYLPFQYGDNQRSLRSSNAHFHVLPLTPNIWPWGQKFKIPPHSVFAYGPKEHSCAFIALSYQNCRRSSRKCVKSDKNGNDLCDLDLWPCDLKVTGVCWPCPYLPTIAIWWWSKVIKVIKCPFQGLTFDP